MAFIDNRDLKVHIRHVHENYRPFECEACHQAYKTKQGLKTHQKAHPEGDCVNLKKIARDVDEDTTDGEGVARITPEKKPFGCPECNKRFTKKSRMESHLRTHSNENKIACSVEGCGKNFTQNQSLRNHLKQIHNIQITSTSTTPSTGINTANTFGTSQESSGLPTNLSHSSNANQIPSEEALNIRNLKQEAQMQPLLTLQSQQSSSIQNLPQSSVNTLYTKNIDDPQGSGRDSVTSHLSDISTQSRSSVVLVEPRYQQLGPQSNDPIQLIKVTSNSSLNASTQPLNSIVQAQPLGHDRLGGMAAHLAAQNTSIPSVAAKAAEAVFGRSNIVQHASTQLRDGRHGTAESWAAAVQVNQHSATAGVSASTNSQFMPLNLQEALVQHQQQNPRLITNAIAQARPSSSLNEAMASVPPTVVPDQHSSASFHQMIQQQQQILLHQQQQQQEDHQRKLKEQKDQRERLARERQLRDHERQQREQQENYQRYQLQQQQQLLQQQQHLAAAQAAAQAQQVQAQQSVVGVQQASSTNPSSAGAIYYNRTHR